MNRIIFNEIKSLKRQILPNDRLILFGSQARGDEKEDSDWDLVILLNKDKINFKEDNDNYAYPFTELGWDYGVVISALVYSKEQWEKGKIFPFYKNVMKEGIEIQ